MSISVRLSNLGPLRSAGLDLSELTLLTGENNTGKTFFATVLHRVMDYAPFPRWRVRTRSGSIPEEITTWLGDVIHSLEGDVPVSRMPEFVPDGTSLEWIEKINRDILASYGSSVRDSVSYAFGAEPDLLRRRTETGQATDCYLKIRSKEPSWDVEIRFDSDDVAVTPPDSREWLLSILNLDNVSDTMAKLPRRGIARSESDEMAIDPSYALGPMLRRAQYNLFSSWPHDAVHLPAERAGIMQSHNVLAAAAARLSARAGIKPIKIEALSGTSADFLSLILEIPETPSYAYNLSQQPLFKKRHIPRMTDIATRFEQDIRASIEIDRQSNGMNAIVAATPEGEFPIMRSSSMLSELAPLLLVLKSRHRVDHMTIDEPEAHLHPGMQRKVASFLAALVDNGIRVVLTTHSDYFVGQFSNMIRRHELGSPRCDADSDKQSQPFGESVLSRDKIRSLLFSRENGFCVAQESEPDRIDGIDESTFTEVMRSQYDETAELVNELLEVSQE